jgi:hypothetical protein
VEHPFHRDPCHRDAWPWEARAHARMLAETTQHPDATRDTDGRCAFARLGNYADGSVRANDAGSDVRLVPQPPKDVGQVG